jgi:hypothetical protein
MALQIQIRRIGEDVVKVFNRADGVFHQAVVENAIADNLLLQLISPATSIGCLYASFIRLTAMSKDSSLISIPI